MPKYVVLLKWTGQGMKNVKDSPARVDAARRMIEAAGGKMDTYLVTMGQYDGLSIIDLPTDEAAAQLALATGMQGNVSTETMRAFTLDEFKQILGRLP